LLAGDILRVVNAVTLRVALVGSLNQGSRRTSALIQPLAKSIVESKVRLPNGAGVAATLQRRFRRIVLRLRPHQQTAAISPVESRQYLVLGARALRE
jgi:hypothetical protein